MTVSIIICGQNETVRKSVDQRNIRLCTMGLKSCVAVIITDKSGNISLTHVDGNTDLSFIPKEITEFMKGGYNIDVVAVDGLMGEYVATKVSAYLKESFPTINNSKGNQNIRKIKESTDYSRGVMVDDLVDQSGNFQISLKQPVWQDLEEFGDVRASENAQKRIYQRQIAFYFLRESMPHLAFADDNFIEYEAERTDLPQIQRFLESVKGKITDPAFVRDAYLKESAHHEVLSSLRGLIYATTKYLDLLAQETPKAVEAPKTSVLVKDAALTKKDGLESGKACGRK